MIPELGQLALILALGLAFLQAVLPMYGLIRKQKPYYAAARPLSIGVAFFITLAFLALLFCFAQDDFSVTYVAHHSNSALPLRYKLSALWGGHAGSLLLWIWMLSCWILCFNIRAKQLEVAFLARMLSYLAWVMIGFLLFLLTRGNPFLREYPNIPLDGVDLNPLLQDPGLIFHPPLLYMGYVGSSIVAAFAVAFLFENKIPQNFALWVRPWLLASFGFLTIGISWGSYWAYYELGWGGFWFWDPVENASFIPWLVLVALIHSLIVVRKRQQLYGFTIMLMIVCFALSLLGTFLVRSGMVTSVHSFAEDPKSGLVILLLLTLLIGPVLLRYAYCSEGLFTKTNMLLASREAWLLLNVIIIVVAAASILLGTLFPLAYEFIFKKTISVGFPYFNMIFIPLMIPVLFSIPLGPFIKWGDNSVKSIARKMGSTFWVSGVLAITAPFVLQWQIGSREGDGVSLVDGLAVLGEKWLNAQSLLMLVGFFLSFWVGFGTLLRLRHKIKTEGARGISVNAWGMMLAHFGVGLIVFGLTIVSHYQIEKDVRLTPNAGVKLGRYNVRLIKIEKTEGENYVGHRGFVAVEKEGKKITELYPEKRHYVVSSTTLSETAIDANAFRDIYIALGEPVSMSQSLPRVSEMAWTLRVYYKPGVRWIWVGAFFIALACFLIVFSAFRKPSNLKS